MKKIKLIALALLVALIIPFTVNAKTYNSVDEFIKAVPDTINISSSDVKKVQKAYKSDESYDDVVRDIILDQYASTLSINNYSVTIGNKEYDDNYSVTIGNVEYDVYFALYDFFDMLICVWNDYQTVAEKSIKINYNIEGDSNYSKTDHDYIDKLMENVSLSYFIMGDSSLDDYKSYLMKFINNQINDSSIKVYFFGGGCGSDKGCKTCTYDVFIEKNDILYYATTGEVFGSVPTYIVSDSVADTDEAYAKAALATGSYSKVTYENIKKVWNLGYVYDALDSSGEEDIFLIIKKKNSTKVMDGVLVDDVTDLYIKGSTLANTDTTYKNLNTQANNKGYNTVIKAINLTNQTPKVESKIKVTVTVDAKYNGKKVLVTSKKGTGYETQEVQVANGKVVVTLSEVSPLLISEKVVTNPTVAITSVKINESSLIVAIGKTKKLTATINPSNTTQSKTLTWSSSNTKVATVDSNGNVKGIKAGTATITVKTSNGKTASLKVTVKKATPIKSVKLNKSSAKLAIGKTLQLKATINPTATTDDTTLTWSSSNKKVATVDSNGKVTAVAAGTAKITVKTSNGKKKTIKVTVSKISAKKAKIAAIENQVQTGKAIKPTVTVTLNGTTLKSGTDYTVTYKNNKKAGKATVTVKFKGNYTGTVKTTFLIIPKKVSIKTPTTTKKAITVKYTKVSGATTYQIAYRVKGTTEWKYTTSTSASKKISKLTSGKEYEVMVRAGIKSGSKKIYGEWSDVKTITVK